MAIETNTYETPKQQTAANSGSATDTAQKVVDKGAEAYVKAEHVAGDAYEKAGQVAGEAYDKTTQKATETYEKAKHYSGENPGKTIYIFIN